MWRGREGGGREREIERGNYKRRTGEQGSRSHFQTLGMSLGTMHYRYLICG